MLRPTCGWKAILEQKCYLTPNIWSGQYLGVNGGPNLAQSCDFWATTKPVLHQNCTIIWLIAASLMAQWWKPCEIKTKAAVQDTIQCMMGKHQPVNNDSTRDWIWVQWDTWKTIFRILWKQKHQSWKTAYFYLYTSKPGPDHVRINAVVYQPK